MNLLYYHPIIMPVSSGCGDVDISIKVLYAILIVVNIIWLISFIVAKIHNFIINRKRVTYRDRLCDREYLFWSCILAMCVDAIAIFFVLVFWVYSLL